MEQNKLTCGLPQKTVTAMMMLYKNTIGIVCSPDGSTDFFDIFTGVLQRRYIISIYEHNDLDHVLRTLIGLIKYDLDSKIARTDDISTETNTDEDYGNYLILIANTTT